MKKAVIFIVLAFLLVLCAAPAYAQPTLPHAFYGSVEINGSSAPNGTQVSAKVDNGTIIPTQNPVTTVGGSYGVNSLKLLVQGDIPPGATITFHVKGVQVKGVTATFEAGGGPDKRNLSVTIAAPAGGGGAAPRYYIDTNFFDVEEQYRTSLSGELRETIEATSEDEKLIFTVPEGTIALDEDDNRLRTLEATIDENPPDPPEDANIIGLAYDFRPDGASFDPPITMEFSYDPAALPEGVAEEDLVLAYYDEEAGGWVELNCVVDTENNTVTAYVSHFTTFAILGYAVVAPPAPAPAAFSVSNLSVQPAEIQPEEVVTIMVLIANTGGTEGSYSVVLKINDAKEAEKRVTIAAGKSRDVSFTVTREETGSYDVAVDGLSASFTVAAPAPPPAPAPAPPEKPPVPAKPPVDWPLIGEIIGAVVVIGLLIFFLVRSRRRRLG